MSRIGLETRASFNHTIEEHEHCYDENCLICVQGLSHCTTCDTWEGQMPTHCPGRECTEGECEAIHQGELDFVDGHWINQSWYDTLISMMDEKSCELFDEDASLNTIVHECFHLTHRILEYIGASFEHETAAYLHEHVFEQVATIVIDDDAPKNEVPIKFMMASMGSLDA